MNTNNFIELIDKYAFNNHNIHNLISSEYFELKPILKKKQTQIPIKKNNDFFIPTQKDNIFWCWYIFKYGLCDYESIYHKYFTIEKTKKISFIEKIRANKKFLKNLKIKTQIR